MKISIYPKILLSLLALILILAAQLRWIDDIGENYTEQGLKRALVTYGIARGLNGVISVAQGTEVAVEPVGVGLTFTPGQILDPINDLIERFSWVVLASSASLGVQRILIQITSWYWFSILVSLFLFLSVYRMWRQPSQDSIRKSPWLRVAMVLVVIRFMIPVIAIVNEGIYLVFLQPQYEESRLKLEQTTESMSQQNTAMSSVDTEQELSFVEKVQNMYESATNAVDFQRQLDDLKQTAAQLSEDALNMIVVFVVQTILFPLLFLWLSIKLIKQLAKP